jgi:glycosyltransferase involved in cell wall biosynthesis
MTRVVHVVVAGEIGGAERMLADLAAPHRSGDVEPSVAVIGPDDAVADLLRAAGARVSARRSTEGPLAILRQSFGRADVTWLAGVLRESGAHIVHLHTFASQVVGTRAARVLGRPVVRTEHSTRAFVDPTCWPFTRWALARAAASVSVSRHVRAVAASRAPWAAGRMRVVANGVDALRFAPSAPPPAGPLRLAIVGRLEPRKGLDVAIECVARVEGVHLDVVGTGALRGDLERLTRRVGAAGRIRFLGFVDDVRPALSACHAVLCTSRSEGLGLGLLEAMASERPVIGFRVGGVGEIVDAELGALLVPPGNEAALVAALREASADPARLSALGARARRRVVEAFSVDAMRAAYARTYRHVLEPAGATIPLP